jgi:integron integrase
MLTAEFQQLVVTACRREHKSEKTLEKYVCYVRQFGVWMHQPAQKGLRAESSEVKVSSFLSWMANRPGGCSRDTQHGALCALVFAYKKGLGKPLKRMPDWVKPPETKRLPVWLSSAEFTAMERHLEGACLEMAQICFGAGLRHAEVIELRVRDIDFDSGYIVVREGKGKVDRLTKLPNLLVAPLRERLFRLEDLWKLDREHDGPGVALPDDVGRKYPNYGKDWPWQWLFPSRKMTGKGRKHVDDDTLGKAIKRAAFKARLRKRVTVHTLRHSFATAFLTNGGSIHVLQKLLGHKRLETTEIYVHCIPQVAASIVSPLDFRPNVLPFVAPEPMVAGPLVRVV